MAKMLTLPKSRILNTDQLGTGVLEAFDYPSADGSDGSPAGFPAPASRAKPAHVSSAELLWPTLGGDGHQITRHTEQEVKAREKKAWEAGFEEGRKKGLLEAAENISTARAGVAVTLEDFAGERELYYQRVEGEVVSLALAIARRVLHREAQLDPMMLKAVAHFALTKIAEGTSVRLRVNPQQVEAWQEVMNRQQGLKVRPAVVADPAVSRADCLLETEVGSTDLSVETQLEEIEKGFFDLLAARPSKL
ncbi:MAG: FliH/SctL family protein [Terriglobia bacterium]